MRDGGHRVGDRLCRALVAGCQGGTWALGGAVLGLLGHGSLEGLYLVSDLATAGWLGASGAGPWSHDRAGRAVANAWGSPARTSPRDVSRLASGTGRHAELGASWCLSEAGPPGSGALKGSRFVEAMMTVVATLTQQYRHVLAYVTATCEAALRDEPAPSWRPTAEDLHRLMHLAA